jgi:hypothetical protein
LSSDDSLDDLFERNADMRLLERRHQEVGAPKSGGQARRVGGGFGAESIVAVGAGEIIMEDAARLRVEIAAAPATGAIPGAVIGVAVDVTNDGTATAPEALLLLSVPHESDYRHDSLRVDGQQVAAPERLFSAGLPIAALPAAASTKVTFQLQVLAGVSALILQPRLEAKGTPIVGTVGISIKRGTIQAVAPPAQPPPRPFYELEEDELDEVAVAEHDLPIMPPVQARLAAVVEEAEQIEELAAEPGLPEQLAIALPEPEPEPKPAPVELRAARYRPCGVAEIALLERLFAAEAPGPIAHLMTISMLACTQDAGGADVGGFDAAVRRNAETLGKALVMQRLGKAPGALVSPALLAGLSADAETPAAPIPAGPLLRRVVRHTDGPAIANLLRTSDRDPTMRFHLVLVALGAEAIDGLGNPGVAADAAVALVSYRANVLAWLSPACVASAGVTGPPPALPAPPPGLDAAARRLVSALKTAL